MEQKTPANVITLLLSVLLLFSTALMSVASAQQYPVPKEQTVVVETDTLPTIFDKANPFIPAGTQWGSGWHQVANEWDWYINYATGEIIYWRITGWEYRDGYTTYIHKVRPGVTWNDGQPYTAKDIAFTINMLMEAGIGPAAVLKEWVKSVSTPDDYTLEIKLTKPNPRVHQWFRMWGLISAVAEHVWKGKDPKTFANWPPVETGPYKLYRAYPDLKLFVWERREDYWGKAFGVFPSPKYVIYRYAPPPDIDLPDFVKGLVDAPLPHIFSWEMIKTAQRLSPNVVVAPYLDPCPVGVSAINIEKPPFDKREVRWALAYLLDREKLARLYPMAEKSDPVKYPWPVPAYAAFNKYIPMAEEAMRRISSELGVKFEYNPSKAIELLESVGIRDRDGDGLRDLPDGGTFKVEVLSRPPTVANEHYIAVSLVEELKKIGVDASIRTVDPAIWHELTALGNYEVAVGSLCTPGWISGDMLDVLDVLHSRWYKPSGERTVGGGIHGAHPRYKNPELDEIIDRLSVLGPDSPEAQDLYKQGIYIMMRDLVTIPAVEKMFVQVFSNAHFTGWPSTDNMYMVPYQWWPSFIFVLSKLKPTPPPPAPPGPQTVTRIVTSEVVTTVVRGETIVQTVARTIEQTVTREVPVEIVPGWVLPAVAAGIVIGIAGIAAGLLVRRRAK